MYLKITIQLDNRNMCIKIKNMGSTLKQTKCETTLLLTYFRGFETCLLDYFVILHERVLDDF
jgi:hypothetical protein